MKKFCSWCAGVIGFPMTVWLGGVMLTEGHFPGCEKMVGETIDTGTVLCMGFVWVLLPLVCAGIGALIGAFLSFAFYLFVSFCHFVSTTFGGDRNAAKVGR